jgi:exonuclease V gamma subunit
MMYASSLAACKNHYRVHLQLVRPQHAHWHHAQHLLLRHGVLHQQQQQQKTHINKKALNTFALVDMLAAAGNLLQLLVPECGLAQA